MMKRHFLYNILLNIALILMFLSTVAAYNNGQYAVMAISIAITAVLAYLKYRLLTHVRKLTKKS